MLQAHAGELGEGICLCCLVRWEGRGRDLPNFIPRSKKKSGLGIHLTLKTKLRLRGSEKRGILLEGF